MSVRRPQPALVLATLALVVAAASPAYALVAKNSVGSKQIKNHSIKAVDLHGDSVTAGKIAKRSVTASDLVPDAVRSGRIADGQVRHPDIAKNAVDALAIVDGSVTTDDLESPVQARRWVAYPTSDVPVKRDASIALGSLGTNGGGPLVLSRRSTLLITGQVYFSPADNPDTAFKGRLVCTLAVDGARLQPQSWARVAQGDETTLPVSASKAVSAGTHDVSLSCRNPTNGPVTDHVGRVGVSVLAVPR